MEKLVYLLETEPDNGDDALRHRLTTELAPQLLRLGVGGLRINVVDSAVAAADSLRMLCRQPPVRAMISFWMDSAIGHPPLSGLISGFCSRHSAFVVSESEPLPNRPRTTAPGERTPGMNEVVLLRVPERLQRTEWLEIWLNSHTQVALDTQSTFGYRQNVVVRPLNPEAIRIDAIVEENFPAAAMADSSAFYDCTGQPELLKQRQTAMYKSCQRFIDFDQLDCLPMSEYDYA